MNLNEYPEAIEATRLELQTLADEAEQIRESLGQIADQITANVASAQASDGKPLYSNESKRKAQIATDLAEHKLYQSQSELLRSLEKSAKRTDARLERLRGEFACAKLEARQKIAEAEIIAA